MRAGMHMVECDFYAGSGGLLGVLNAFGVKLRFSFSSALAEVEPALGRRMGVFAGVA